MVSGCLPCPGVLRPERNGRKLVGTPENSLPFTPPQNAQAAVAATACAPPLHHQPRGHLCLTDLPDVAVGFAWGFAVRADSRLHLSHSRPRSLAVPGQRVLRELSDHRHYPRIRSA